THAIFSEFIGRGLNTQQKNTVDGVIWQVMDTLIGAQAWDGKTLFKQLWQVAPKTPLPELIKMSRTAKGYAPDGLDAFDDRWVDIFDPVLSAHKIKFNALLLPNLAELDPTAEGFDLVGELKGLTIEKYLGAIFKKKYDPLIETVFRVKDKPPFVEG